MVPRVDPLSLYSRKYLDRSMVEKQVSQDALHGARGAQPKLVFSLDGRWDYVGVPGNVPDSLDQRPQSLRLDESRDWDHGACRVAVERALGRVTSGLTSAIRLQPRGTTHAVALKWQPSSSRVAGYNVYRSMTPAGNYVQINSSLVQGVTFTDNTVESGLTYYYVTRAVDTLGHESVNSNEARAAIP